MYIYQVYMLLILYVILSLFIFSGVFMRDVTLYNEGNPKRLKNGLLNFAKLRALVMMVSVCVYLLAVVHVSVSPPLTSSLLSVWRTKALPTFQIFLPVWRKDEALLHRASRLYVRTRVSDIPQILDVNVWGTLCAQALIYIVHFLVCASCTQVVPNVWLFELKIFTFAFIKLPASHY